MTNQERVKSYTDDVYTLVELVKEMLETFPVEVLSPVLRKLVVAHAYKLKDKHAQIAPYLEVASFKTFEEEKE
jgi:hypothetical protein